LVEGRNYRLNWNFWFEIFPNKSWDWSTSTNRIDWVSVLAIWISSVSRFKEASPGTEQHKQKGQQIHKTITCKYNLQNTNITSQNQLIMWRLHNKWDNLLNSIHQLQNSKLHPLNEVNPKPFNKKFKQETLIWKKRSSCLEISEEPLFWTRKNLGVW